VSTPAVLALTAVVVLAVDQAVKLLFLRVASPRVVEGRLWVTRAGERHPNALWLWVMPAAALALVTAWMPSASFFVGLMVGGSLSNALEGSLRGAVTDHFSLRFWPAFNIADVALTVGAVGIAVELLRRVGEIPG
jgi:signal peptidase II